LHKAKELAFTGKIISGIEASELGLVNAVVPAGDLDAAVDDIASTVAAGPPIALSMTKRQLDNTATASLAQALEVEALAQTVNASTADLREALIAFMEKRPPNFTGR
jgi:2-(1,2-epoxy-1,2-dihydrophenyl)acetyl-CoA isomerase